MHCSIISPLLFHLSIHQSIVPIINAVSIISPLFHSSFHCTIRQCTVLLSVHCCSIYQFINPLYQSSMQYPIVPLILPLFHLSMQCSIHQSIVPLIHPLYHLSVHCSTHPSIVPFINPLYHLSIHCTIHQSIVLFINPLYHSSIHCTIYQSIVPPILMSIVPLIHPFV